MSSPRSGGHTSSVWWLPSFFGVTMAVVVMTTAFLVPVKADDIWWHLATGRHIVQFGLPASNIFSFTAPDHPWLPHGWLSGLIFYGLFSSMGELWPVLLAVIVNGATCGLLYMVSRRGGTSSALASCITLLAAFLMLANYSLRPYLFGNLLLAVTLLLVESPRAGGQVRMLLVALLFAAWSNLHGSFAFGLALVLLALVASQIEGARAELKGRCIDLCVALVASLATPHHVRGLVLPLTYAGHLLGGESSVLDVVSEWQRVGLATPLGMVLAGAAVLAVVVVVVSERRPRFFHVSLGFGGAALAFGAIRNAPLLAIFLVPLLAKHLPPALDRVWAVLGRQRGDSLEILKARARRLSDIEGRSAGVTMTAMSLVVLVTLFALPASSMLSFSSLAGVDELSDLTPASYPREAIEELHRGEQGQRIFNYYDWGGAMIWALSPDHRVFIDQRNDCYPSRVFQDYMTVHRVEAGWQEVLDHWRVEVVVYPRGSELEGALRRELSWRVEYEDEQAVVFMRPQRGDLFR